jgi:hypothetical protein
VFDSIRLDEPVDMFSIDFFQNNFIHKKLIYIKPQRPDAFLQNNFIHKKLIYIVQKKI